jgi:membrane-associated phospholipid phosphatase
MNNFWVRILLLAMIVAALGFYRVSPNKVKEQNIVVELQLKQTPDSTAFFQWISTWGSIFNIGIPVAFLFAGLIHKRRLLVRNALIVLLGMALGGLIARAIKVTVREPRPYEVDSRIAQLGTGGSNSFPSGHTVEVTAAAIGTTLLLYRTPVAGIIAATWALLIMLSRIVLGVHNVTDILAGIVVGCLSLLIINEIFQRKVSYGND